jgi:DNA-binding CsgD family transcriptional regulator
MEPVFSATINPAQGLEDRVASVYRYAVGKGAINALRTVADDLVLGVPDVTAAVRQLLSYRLLREENHPQGRLVPVDPEIAAASLVSSMEREIYQRREQIAQIQERSDALRQDYVRSGPAPTPLSSVEHVAGPMEVGGFLKLAADACDQEVVVLRSGRPDASALENFLRITPRLIERGVTVQVLCEHRSRADFTARMKIKNLIDDGAQVRTVSQVPRAAVIFDRSLAILLGFCDGEVMASRVRSGHVVQFLLDMTNHLWDAATGVDSFESGYAEVADDLQLTMVSLMARGYTDEILARKLGMSVRTCRRHIATMMHELNAVSRFQAGVRASGRLLGDR